MSKKPLLEENVARRWAKYAGIQQHAENFLTEAYKMPVEEEMGMKKAPKIKDVVRPGGDEAKEAGMPMEEADVLEELEGLLEQDIDVDEEMEDDAGEEDVEADIEIDDDEDMDMDMDDEEVEMDAEVSMSQDDVQAALKAGLEAMASAIGDALKIKIDVRSGGEDEEMEAEEEVMEMEKPMEETAYGPMDEEPLEEGDKAGDESKTHKGEKDYTTKKGEEKKTSGKGRGEKKGDEAYVNEEKAIDRDELVERVMKRVAARLVKEAKENK